MPGPRTSPWSWRLNDNLLRDEVCCADIRTSISQFVSDHVKDTTSPTIKWEALKCTLRGLFIAHGSRLKKILTQDIEKYLRKIADLENRHKKHPHPDLLLELSTARCSLLTLLNQKSLRARDKFKRLFYEHGDKPGKLLARAIHSRNTSHNIPAIQTQTGELTRDPTQIVDQFKEYYEKLYNLDKASPTASNVDLLHKVRSYVTDTALPTISAESRESLDEPFTLEELNFAIKTLVVGKSPGPDGYTSRFYKMFKDNVELTLLNSFNAVSSMTPFPAQALEAQVVVIPKPGKDATLCGSYRPISLTNIDIRLYAKMIANRLKPLITSLIHLDQVGFTPGREARDNVMKTVSLIETAHARKIPMCIISVDAEKAFDRVAWPFMRETLRQIGLGPMMLQKILMLYDHPTARVRAATSISAPINIRNGTRQGCPLSPLIYILTMEHLAVALRQNLSVQGVNIGEYQFKLSLYADDLLLYVTSPHTTLPSIVQEFERFGEVSNFKVNMEKTEILNISLSSKEVQRLKSNFSFKWQAASVRYLGVQITRNTHSLFEANYSPLSISIQTLLRQYDRAAYSWWGRIGVIKMDILPKFLYLFQALPLQIPDSYFLGLTKMIRYFVWNGKKARVPFSTLVQPKHTGGVALPDLKLYYQSSVLCRLVDHYHNGDHKLWVKLEQELSPGGLRVLPHVPPSKRRTTTDVLTLVKATLHIWDRNIMSGRVSSIPNPLTTLFDNPDFVPATQKTSFLKWLAMDSPKMRDTLSNNLPIPLAQILPGCLNSRMAWLEYSQLIHYFNSHPNIPQFTRDLTQFEKLLESKQKPAQVISQIYQILLAENYSQPPLFVARWERELQAHGVEGIDWSRSFLLSHKMSMASRAQERNYKIMSRWYKCPTVLHQIDPSVPSTCWRCGKDDGNMTHIWGTCPDITAFWDTVLTEYKKVTGTVVERTLPVILFSIIPGTLRSIKRDIFRHCLTAARTVIARKWRSPDAPTITEWYMEMDMIHSMEDMYLRDHGWNEIYMETWAAWKIYRDGLTLLNP